MKFSTLMKSIMLNKMVIDGDVDFCFFYIQIRCYSGLSRSVKKKYEKLAQLTLNQVGFKMEFERMRWKTIFSF